MDWPAGWSQRVAPRGADLAQSDAEWRTSIGSLSHRLSVGEDLGYADRVITHRGTICRFTSPRAHG